MSESPDVFQLQLACQKLEEEVKLYRNGATAENLLELVNEKDREIAVLNNSLRETAEKLRRIAKGSSELITKCENLQREREIGLRNEKELSDQNSSLISQAEASQQAHASLQLEKNELVACVNSGLEKISRLEQEILDRNEDISKLQLRCSELITEKAMVARQLKAKEKEVGEYSAQLEKGIKFNSEIKDMLRAEKAVSSSHSAELAKANMALQGAMAAIAAIESANLSTRNELDEANSKLRMVFANMPSESTTSSSSAAVAVGKKAAGGAAVGGGKAVCLKDRTNEQYIDAVDAVSKPDRHYLAQARK